MRSSQRHCNIGHNPFKKKIIKKLKPIKEEQQGQGEEEDILKARRIETQHAVEQILKLNDSIIIEPTTDELLPLEIPAELDPVEIEQLHPVNHSGAGKKKLSSFPAKMLISKMLKSHR